MKFLTSWIISNCPSPHYLLTTPLPNRNLVYVIYRTRLEVRQCYHSSYVVYVSFSIAYYLENNYMYHMAKCNLLLVICRSWNHNIDAGLSIIKVLI